MPLVDWNEVAGIAAVAIQDAGFPVTIRRIVEGAAPDPTKPWIVAEHNPDADTLFRSNMIWDWSPYMVEQTEDSSVARNAYIAPFGAELVSGDILEIVLNDVQQNWTVETKTPIDTGGIVVLWQVKARRWPLSSTMPQTQ